ncbi:MAG: PVC-type heme-binding CxxCH protein [Limisphaerales bacterium]
MHSRLARTLCLAGFVAALPTAAEVPLPQVERLQTSPVLRHLQPNPTPAPAASEPAKTVAAMHVPPGFRAVLVAAEPDVRQPVAFAIDERGRLWIAEAHSYPTRRPAGEGLDRLVILADNDANGTFESRKVFAEGLNLVSGFEVGHGGVWVGAAPELLFIADRDRDDVPDGPPEVLLDGFGYQDTHECLNSFLWGPDGWLYGIQGVFNLAHIGRPGAADADRRELRAGVWRYHPVRHEFEVFAHGGSNPWGLDFDSRGQLFMTHCRSYWGRGGTTHVIQNGQFWNQANANYAPFIVADPPREFPSFRNYLLASARYDHGAGGAGAPGTDAIYGGHSHVGTMIYLGDNWPDEYRGRLFTHNLHGHQINQQVNRPWGSGFDTVHAGQDLLFCSDPAYVAIDLQYGPDGAVYFIDWYDRAHCHNPNAERWDRGNGRVYRLQWDDTYKPTRARLDRNSPAELVALHGHRNDWFARTARRLLHERAVAGTLPSEIIPALGDIFSTHVDPAIRLRALWTLHAVGHFTDAVADRALRDPDEYVRAWGVQLAADDRELTPSQLETFARLAQSDPSQVVRRHLASAIPRIPVSNAWTLIERLARHGEDREDRNLPYLLWHVAAPILATDIPRALLLADSTPLDSFADWIHWYAATLGGDALNRAVAALAAAGPDDLPRRLAGLWLAMEPRANVPMPAAWKELAPRLDASGDPRIQRQGERLAAAFGDDSHFPRLRATLADSSASAESRRHAFGVLSRAQDRASLPVFLQLLDDPALRPAALGILARFDNPEIPPALIERFGGLPQDQRGAVLNSLTSRPAFALALLEAVESGRIQRDQVTAFHIRQLANLRNPEVDRVVAATWGRIQQTPAEKQALIAAMEKTFDEAPLWAYDGNAGREHFKKLCAQCHVLGQDGVRVGPELSGAGKNGIRYYLENILDPNAVIGTDFQATTIDTKSGDTVSGLILQETDSAITLRTTTEQRVIAKADIAERSRGELSLMPEGLLESIPPREQIELLKYLTSH